MADLPFYEDFSPYDKLSDVELNSFVKKSLFIRKSSMNIEEATACSMALGHEDLSITFGSYGVLTPNQQLDVFDRMRDRMQTETHNKDPFLS